MKGLPDGRIIFGNWKTSDGTLMFGGMDGIALFDPDKIAEQYNRIILPPSISVVFTDITVNGKIQNLGPDPSHPKALDSLNHSENNLSFEFAYLDYTDPEQTEYSVKLEGADYDDDWEITLGPHMQYSKLPYGDYTFRVAAQNINGNSIRSLEEAILEFRIQPPLQSTMIFRFFMVLVLVSLIFYIHKLKVVAIKRRNIKLREVVAMKTSELQEINVEVTHQKNEL